MADLIPSNSSDLDDEREGRDPRVIGLDSDEADELLAAISSSTARSVLASLHEAPATSSELAADVDTSLQNVQYHLGNLSDAGLIEVVDTRYSEKGREMKVYTPSDRALVVVAGREDETRGLKGALSRLIGGIGVLGVGGVVVNRLARTGSVFPFAATGGADGGSAESTEASDSGGAGGSGGAANESTSSDVAVSYEGEDIGVNSRGGGETTAADATTTAEGDGGYSIAESTTTESADQAQTVTEEATRTVAEETTQTVAEEATRTVTETAASTPTPAPTDEPATAAESVTTTESVTTAVQTATETAAQFTSGSPGVTDTIGVPSPGAMFFLGGLTVLLVWVAVGVLRD
ncbi:MULTISPECIES: helix-turn-helix domain-containing protein [Haloferax]|uniref:Helix-turn-helix domain-containing protein n=1 Tax=Haloferax marinum TaxID=2666143 RepID=A0A6A8G8B6_9EURY|nr:MULTISPECIES: helix-turn-helix domain-containing protein [Haloferax]KAB1197478.1 helix-turn-helix domain-containing protein [Haloferax sp. CBA1150]MRW96523.1 helix-turn-helix domain-containing protein [Haloferax marinum]